MAHRALATSSFAAEIAAGAADIREVRLVAERLADLYLRERAEPPPPGAYRQRIEEAICRRSHVLGMAAGVPRPLVLALASELLSFAADNAELLERRASLLVDGDGDPTLDRGVARPEPVTLDSQVLDPPDPVDPADELAALDMECTRMGAHWVGPELLAAWSRRSGDAPPPALLAFYRSARAVRRAELAWERTLDAAAGEREGWLDVAGEYLALAAYYAEALR